MIISCTCLFLCTSCIHAADIDDASANNSSSVASDDAIDSLPNAIADETPNQDACNMAENSTDFVIVNHNSHCINKTHSSHNSHWHDFNKRSHHFHKIQQNDSDFKIKDNSKVKLDNDLTISDYKINKYDVGSEYALDDSRAVSSIEKTSINAVVANGLSISDECSFCSSNQCTKATKESEFCFCGKENCHHQCVEDILGIGNHIDGDLAYLCSFYTQIKVINDVVVKSRNMDEKERGGYGHLNLDLYNNLTNSAYCMFSQFSYIGLNIDSLHSQDLDIKDYNLEYYMFTNPDIIIKRANIATLAKANTIIFNNNINHCLKTFNNSFLTDKIHESILLNASLKIIMSH